MSSAVKTKQLKLLPAGAVRSLTEHGGEERDEKTRYRYAVTEIARELAERRLLAGRADDGRVDEEGAREEARYPDEREQHGVERLSRPVPECPREGASTGHLEALLQI